MDVTLQQLRMLRGVAHLGTIAGAADRLGYTPSAVSQQLSTLEKAIGIAVLERVGRNVVLTDAGRELVTHAELILNQLDQAKAALEQMQDEVAGELRVFFFGSVGATMLEPIMARLAAAHPALDVRTSFVDRDPSEMVRRGDLDVAFAVEREPDPHRYVGLERMLVARDWVRLVVPSGALDSTGPVSLDVVADRPFIVPPPGDAYCFVVNKALATMSTPPTVAHHIADLPTILRLVATGVAVALVPDLGLTDPPPGIDIVDLEPAQHRVIDVVYRSASAKRPAIQAFLATVAEVADELGLDRS